MRYREFGRLGWKVSEVGYGTWGMGAWSGSDDARSRRALERALELGCDFFDTAWVYGNGHSERLLAEVLAGEDDVRVATKVPPKDMRWPATGGAPLSRVFPRDHILEYTERSLENLDREPLDLQQLHVWDDAWARDEEWMRTAEELKGQGLVRGFGISLNRWEPENGIEAIRTGLVDAVQVIHNIFEQAPEDELFPLCREEGVAVVARVPFDEGSLTGALTRESSWPDDDFRSVYFGDGRLERTLDRVDALRRDLPEDLSLPRAALRFALSHPAVSTVIPGMRSIPHVEENLAASDGGPLTPDLLDRLREHRWDRTPERWFGRRS